MFLVVLDVNAVVVAVGKCHDADGGDVDDDDDDDDGDDNDDIMAQYINQSHLALMCGTCCRPYLLLS